MPFPSLCTANGSDEYVPFTAALYAVQSGHEGIARAILETERRAYGEECWTPLHVAALEGRADLVDLALKHCAAGVNAPGETPRRVCTPLQVAVAHQHKDVVQKLLSVEGIDVNASPEGAQGLRRSAVELAFEKKRGDLAALIIQVRYTIDSLAYFNSDDQNTYYITSI